MDVRVNYDESLPIAGNVLCEPHTATLLMDRKPPMLALTATTPEGDEVVMLVPAPEAVRVRATLRTILSHDWDEADEADEGGPPPLHVA